ncbi:MAG: alpha/beta hydrolase [Micrococcales bacterium]|nr:alpha/beta hydrolase [Micrococcales bacterium]MCL2667717.1 alpha/beta hydrolase [Micrococcales bacterium]
MRQIGRRARRVRTAAVVAVCAAMTVTACGRSNEPPERPYKPEATTAPAPDLQQFYSQTLDWQRCENNSKMQCAELTVPMDYANPGGETITIAVARYRAAKAIGSVVINPGGPGGSGIDFVGRFRHEAGEQLRDNLDIVSFDPRGVQRSVPVQCLPGPELDVFFATDVDPSTPRGLAAAQASADMFGKACLENTGPVLGYIDTVSTARDLDVLRAALRESTLTYLGFSYGTQLGATYAELFPKRVGRMVLDGAVDPTMTPSESSITQAGGFESALRAYAADCLKAKDCPMSGTVDDAVQQIGDVLDQARARPLKTSSKRVVTGTLAFYGIAVALYRQDSWRLLTEALRPAINDGDGTALLWNADAYFDRDPDGTYTTNSIEAFIAISCADARGDVTPEVMAAEVTELKRVAPTFWQYFAYDAIGCANWPTPVAEQPAAFTASGAPPIVVVGTTNDPATPYAQAKSLAAMLESGRLVTYEGEGHCAYLTAGSCIRDAVDGFLVDGTVPKDGLKCR